MRTKPFGETPGPELSEAGRAKREAALVELTRVVVARGQRRRVVRTMVAVAPVLVTAVVTIVLAGRGALKTPAETPTPGPIAAISEATAAGHKAAAGPSIEIIESSSSVLAEAMVRTVVDAAETVDDDELQQALRAAGQDPGLVRIGERVVLASQFTAATGASGG